MCGDDVVRVDWLLKTRRDGIRSRRARDVAPSTRAHVDARERSARAPVVSARFELDRTDDDDALRAMRDAARAAIDVAMSHRRVARVAETKRDATVATTADVAAQAACARRLRERAATATTTFVGEETSRAVEDARVMKDVVDACAGTIGAISVEEVRSALTSRAPSAGEAYFVCDPLDGTKAFVSENEAEQFVFGLARVTPGVGLDRAVMIAPEWPGGGVELVAKKGAGCFARKLEEDVFRRLEMPQPTSLSDELSVVISAHETFEDLPLGKSGVRPTRVSRLCCGSLAKYVKVALGEAHVFIQHPKANGDAFVNSWDHGAGVLICEETGARVTDALGEALRFEESEDKRRFAPGGGGVICAARSIHDDVVRAYARGLEVR